MPKEINLPYVNSPDHRTLLIDNATALLLSTQVSDRVVINLVRLDSILTGEKTLVHDDGRMELAAGTIAESKTQKTVEVTIEVHPGVALVIANTLIATLERLSDTRKILYGIPKRLVQNQAVAPSFPPPREAS